MLTLDRSIPKGIDRSVDLLVQERHRRGDTRVSHNALVLSSTQRILPIKQTLPRPSRRPPVHSGVRVNEAYVLNR